MNKPCRNCNKAIPELAGEPFEPECNGTCNLYTQYANGISTTLDDLIAVGNEILKKNGLPTV